MTGVQTCALPILHDELTANDIKKMEDEIEYRKLVVRKKALDDVKVATRRYFYRNTSITFRFTGRSSNRNTWE